MTNKYFRAVLGIAAAFLIGSTASANVLVNPGFESPDASPGVEYPGGGDGWIAFGGVFTVDELTFGAPGAHGGDQVLKVFGEAGVFQDFATTEGQAWEGSTWVLNDADDLMGDGQIAGVNIEWHNSATGFISADIGGAIDFTATPDEWMQIFVSGVAPVGADIARLVLITGPFAGPGGGAPKFDDAYFAPAAAIPVPGALLLLGSGIFGLVGFRRKSA